MIVIVQELQNYIHKLNEETKIEYNGRFEIELLDYTMGRNKNKLIATFNMKDNLLNTLETECVDFYKFGKGYMPIHIWDKFNEFVNKQLKNK